MHRWLSMNDLLLRFNTKHDIVFLQKRERQITLFRPNCRLYLKFWTLLNEGVSHAKTIETNIEYKHERYATVIVHSDNWPEVCSAEQST